MTSTVLDGNKIKSELDFHKALNDALDFGPYYGNNLNALWDVLTTDVERPCEVIWTDFLVSERSIGTRIIDLVSLLNKVAERDMNRPSGKRFTFKIEVNG